MQTPKQGQLFLLKQNSRGQRPVLVVSREELNRGNSVLVVPFYSQQLEKRKEQPWCVFFYQGEGGLDKDCVAKPDEISTLDKTKIDFAKGSIGSFDSEQLARIFEALQWVIGK